MPSHDEPYVEFKTTHAGQHDYSDWLHAFAEQTAAYARGWEERWTPPEGSEFEMDDSPWVSPYAWAAAASAHLTAIDATPMFEGGRTVDVYVITEVPITPERLQRRLRRREC
jgi:hypothetical protein